MHNKWFLIGLIFLISVQFSYAQNCEEFIGEECSELKWEKVDARTGEVAEIAISSVNPDIMYVSFEVNVHALYKSTDGGQTWRPISGPGDHGKAIAISPQDPNKVFVALSESVHSTDLTIKTWLE